MLNLLRIPKGEFLEGLPGLAEDRFRGEGRGLAAQVRLAEDVIPDALQIAARGRAAERLFVGRRTEHERGDVVTIPETDSGFVRGVSSLNGLLCEGEVFADNDVEVFLGDLRFLHDPKTTSPAYLCQENSMSLDLIWELAFTMERLLCLRHRHQRNERAKEHLRVEDLVGGHRGKHDVGDFPRGESLHDIPDLSGNRTSRGSQYGLQKPASADHISPT
jgi:hypothetical protein